MRFYLAGAISDGSKQNWKDPIKENLRLHECVDPCEKDDVISLDVYKAIRKEYGRNHPITRALILSIYDRDKKLVENCDAIIARIVTPSTSVGTHIEMEWAFAQGKPVFAYIDDNFVYEESSAFLDQVVYAFVKNETELLDAIEKYERYALNDHTTKNKYLESSFKGLQLSGKFHEDIKRIVASIKEKGGDQDTVYG